MGVPKFYRWISERYPCLSQVVKDYQIPEFDNFYLDMNGIIHSCSHPNDSDPTFRISEEKIFNDIFHYLEVLFRIIKPQKVLFMAIDGVAPRAKMNQQRGRRFRSAKEAEEQARKAVAKGLDLPTEARFDSNCITPGTLFMTRLSEQLKYFVNQKLSTDASWQRVEIIFSGHEVPGEGEHKIMDYIRYSKAQPDYDPNTRHCLYGLDADLIMLGMATHEPHFSLLREEIKFGKSNKKQMSSVDTTTFHLLHLSVLREYLYYEFLSVKDQIKFSFDLESIIDDWIFMGFLVGNDFIPHLPNMHIRQEILPFLYKVYQNTLPKLNGYINENGCLNMERAETYFLALAEFDDDYFANAISDENWLKGKKKQDKPIDGQDDISGFTSFSGVKETEADEKVKRDLGISDLEAYFKEEDNDFNDQFEADLFDFKATYYREKFSMTEVSVKAIDSLAKSYVVGIQWVLSYYYTGVPSWSWFYPYHYAPFVSDIKGIGDMTIKFDLSVPFLPFEQLLAVLPANSKSLLPEAYQSLMIDVQSPVIDFYPVNFDLDLNGKQHDWEAVVLIPLIDEERLLSAMKPLSSYLTDEEVQRNSHGSCLVYRYVKGAPSTTYTSPWPTKFPDVQNCKVKRTILKPDEFKIEMSELVFGLCPSVKLDVFFPGFPTLKHIEHEAFFDNRGVRVFQSVSRGESICLRVSLATQQKAYDIAKELVGKIVYVHWPYLVESRVSSISDGQFTYYDENSDRYYRGASKGRKAIITQRTLYSDEEKLWRDAVGSISRESSFRRGIDVGEISILVYVEELQGKRYVYDKTGPSGVMTMEKQWSASPTPHPLQTIVRNIAKCAPEFHDKVKTLDELFEVDSQCFVLYPPYYGEQAKIVYVDSKRNKIGVDITIESEPDMSFAIDNYHAFNTQYYPIGQVAQRVKLEPALVARITSSLLCEKGSHENKKDRERVNFGLNIKFSSRNKELVGYAKRTSKGWLLSPSAEIILKEYKSKFPVMFSYLNEHPQVDIYYEADLFPADSTNESIVAVKEWLKSLPISELTPVECGSDTLNSSHIEDIEKAVNSFKTARCEKCIQREKYNPSQIYKPADHQGGLIPDEHADFYLFDRVVNVASNGVVPFGLRGTVTGISGDGRDNKTLYEIVFDEEFFGGLSLRCSSNRAYRLPPSCLLNLSYGKRWESTTSKFTDGPAGPRHSTHSRYLKESNKLHQSSSYSAVAGSILPKSQQEKDHSSSYHDVKPNFRSKEFVGTRSMEGRSGVKTHGKNILAKRNDSQAKASEFDLMRQSMNKPLVPTTLTMPQPPQKHVTKHPPLPASIDSNQVVISQSLPDSSLAHNTTQASTSNSLSPPILETTKVNLERQGHKETDSTSSLTPSVAAVFNANRVDVVKSSSSSFPPSVAAMFNANTPKSEAKEVPVVSSVSPFVPAVAAVFAHHSIDSKDSATLQPSSHSERTKQEVDLKNMLGISPPNTLHESICSSSVPPLRGPHLSTQPRLQPPQPRGPFSGGYSQFRGPIMSTGVSPRPVPRHQSQSARPFVPYRPPMVLPSSYMSTPYMYPSPWQPLLHPPYYFMEPPSAILPGNPRGPSLPTPRSSPLNPHSLPFTPLQVQLRHGFKSHHTSSTSAQEPSKTHNAQLSSDDNIVEAVQVSNNSTEQVPHVVGTLIPDASL